MTAAGAGADPPPPLSTRDAAFLAQARRWLAEHGDLLVLARYSRAAGAKDVFLFHDDAAFATWLDEQPAATSVIIFRGPQVPLRGTADDRLADAARALVPDGTEYLIVRLAPPRYAGTRRVGDTHRELTEDLEDVRGEPIAVGPHPQWLHDTDDLVEAIVPDADDQVRRGIY